MVGQALTKVLATVMTIANGILEEEGRVEAGEELNWGKEISKS